MFQLAPDRHEAILTASYSTTFGRFAPPPTSPDSLPYNIINPPLGSLLFAFISHRFSFSFSIIVHPWKRSHLTRVMLFRFQFPVVKENTKCRNFPGALQYVVHDFATRTLSIVPWVFAIIIWLTRPVSSHCIFNALRHYINYQAPDKRSRFLGGTSSR